MLKSDSMMLRVDPITRMIAKANGNEQLPKELCAGVYERGDFGGSTDMPGYEHYPENLSVGAYGVCDSIENLISKCPELVTSERVFVVQLTPVVKSQQSSAGGWRWHKWGEYIGAYEPTTEYLYDEPSIERVYCYQIFEKV